MATNPMTNLELKTLQLQADVLNLPPTHPNPGKIYRLNNRANHIEKLAHELLSKIGEAPRKGNLGNPVVSQERLDKMQATMKVLKDVVDSKTKIRAAMREAGINLDYDVGERLLSYDIREGWGRWGAKHFLGRPIKFIGYTVPKTALYNAPKSIVGRVGITPAVISGAIATSLVYAHVTNDATGGFYITFGGLAAGATVYAIDAACQALKKKLLFLF